MTPFDAYQKFISLKNHFTSNYDYFKYQGKTSVKVESFEKRKDKGYFYKLSKKQDLETFLISNLIGGNVKWVGDLFDDDSDKVYINHKKKTEALTYYFSNDLENLFTIFDDNIIINDGQHPNLLKMYLRNKVNIETLIILNDVFNFFPYWNKKISDTIIWKEVYMKCTKYKPFVKYDIFKCKKILKEKFK
jgi:hypothetical protein